MAKVLVVDDDLNLRQAIAMFLRQGGHDTIEASNGRDAVDVALSHLPDVIILDVMTPEMDGFTACSKIRATPETKNIPIILCTAKNMREDLVQAFQVGANDYVVKPFKKDVILRKVDKVLKKVLPKEELPLAEDSGEL